MPRLDLSQPPLHFVAIFQPSRSDSLLQTLQGLFHAVGKAAADGPLFFFAARRAAQDIGFLALRQGYLFHFYFRPHAGPVLQQFHFKLLHLAARCAYQVLAPSLADGRQILFAHDAAIEHPDPPCLAVLALHHAQDRLHGRNVGTVAIEGLITERKALTIDDERDHHLLTIRTMIPRVAAAHHRILLRRTFYIGARQIVKQ